MKLPTIHSNGSGKNALLRDYMNARSKLRDALREFEAIEFNARDYYPQGPDAFTVARANRDEIASKLIDSIEYLDAHIEHIANT